MTPPEPYLERSIEPENSISIQEQIFIDINVFGNSNAPLPRLNAGPATETARITSALQEASQNMSSIEANFPHIAEKLILVWGYAESFAYLSELIIDNRGNRMGFDREIMSDLMLLLKITEHVTPDKWAHAPASHR